MTKAVIYPGDIEKAGIKSESSIEKDYKNYGKMREVFELGRMYTETVSLVAVPMPEAYQAIYVL